MTAWNPTRIPTFDLVRYEDEGVECRLSFAEFRELPLDKRVNVLLTGKPRFFLAGALISKTRALARRG